MIGVRVRQLRKERGLSITDLAERAGVAKSYLSNIERDIQRNPSLLYLEKISAVLDVSVEQLIEHDLSNSTDEETLDAEWYAIVKEAMESGVDKQQFRDFLEFNKWRNTRTKP
jgi:XRE family transcriptional regulator of biofilm formation